MLVIKLFGRYFSTNVQLNINFTYTLHVCAPYCYNFFSCTKVPPPPPPPFYYIYSSVAGFSITCEVGVRVR